MLQAVDTAIADVIVDRVRIDPAPEVLFDAPTKEWAGRRGTASTINCFLYDIREDTARARLDSVERFEGSGPDRVRIGVQPRVRHLRLSYLLTAWASEPGDEHDVLGKVLLAFFDSPLLPADVLDETARAAGLRATTVVAQMANDRQASDLWSAIGGNLKPAIDLQVNLPVAPTFIEDETKVVEHVPTVELGEVTPGRRVLKRTTTFGGMAATMDDGGNVIIATGTKPPTKQSATKKRSKK